MCFEIVAKIFQRGLKRLDRAGGQGAERQSRPQESALLLKYCQVLGQALSLFNCHKHLFDPLQSFAAWSAPAARFLSKKMLEVLHHAYRTGAIVKHDHGAGPEPASKLLYGIEIHRHIEVLLDEEIG